LTTAKVLSQFKTAEIDDEHANEFMVYETQAGDLSLSAFEICGGPLPSRIISDARRLTIKETVSENIYRHFGQLSRQWKSDRRFESSEMLGWRPDRAGCCVYTGPATGSD
jgi:hypothetical protein